MNKLKITTGLWIIEPDNNWECAVNIGEEGKECNHHINLINNDIEGWEEMHANASLIADAGNTYQKCGLLPSELLEQRDELLAACKEFVRKVECGEARSKRSYAQMKGIINSIEKHENETK